MRQSLAASKWAPFGALGSAFVASACCIIPAVFTVVGLSSFGFAGVFAQYRPYFMTLTFVMLGLAFYRTYRKPKATCKDGCCTVRGTSRWSKISLWVATVFVLTFLSFPYWGALLG